MFDSPTTLQYSNNSFYVDNLLTSASSGGVARDATPNPTSGNAGGQSYNPLISTSYQPIPFDRRFVEHFLELKSLEKNSSLNGDIEPPTKAALAWGDIVLRAFEHEGLVPSRVVSSAEGGVGICFVIDNNYADIECLNTGEILGVITNRNDRPVAWEVGQDRHSIERACSKIAQFLRTENPQKVFAGKAKNGQWFQRVSSALLPMPAGQG